MQSKDGKDTVRIQLTDGQKQLLREVTDKKGNAIVFRVQELEERIAPRP